MFRDFLEALDKLNTKTKLIGLIAVLFVLTLIILGPSLIDAAGGEAASLRRELAYKNGDIAVLQLEIQRLNGEIRDLQDEIRTIRSDHNEEINRIDRECMERVREHEIRTYQEMMELRRMIQELIMTTCSIAEPSEVHINSPAIRHIPTEPYIEEVVPSQLIIQKANQILERIDIKISELKNGN